MTILSGSCVARSFLPLAFLLASCANGDDGNIPPSPVPVTGTFDLVSFRTLRGFTFPMVASNLSFNENLVAMTPDGNYTSSTPLPSLDRYQVNADGSQLIYLQGSPTFLYQGGIDWTSSTASTTSFFTDRSSYSSSPLIGLYCGSTVLTTEPDLAGNWYAMSLHVMLGTNPTTPQAVGRAMHGSVAIDASGTITGGPGNATQSAARNFTPTSSAPLQLPLTVTGSIQHLTNAQNPGGRFTGSLNYDTDPVRAFSSVAGPSCIFAINPGTAVGSDAAGMILFVQKFNVSANPPQTALLENPLDPQLQIAGTYFIGGQRLLLKPGAAGSDTFVGTMVLNPLAAGTRAFQINISGTNSISTYQGTYVAALTADGGLTLSVTSPQVETWFAAVSRDYQTVVLVDDYPELQASNQSELSLSIGTRQKN